jgi:hypothetical protein
MQIIEQTPRRETTERTERTETGGERTETTQITLGYFELAGITDTPVF